MTTRALIEWKAAPSEFLLPRFKVAVVGGSFHWRLAPYGKSVYCMVDTDMPEGHALARVFEAMAAGTAVILEERLVCTTGIIAVA